MTPEETVIPTVQDIEQIAALQGFTDEDFEIFEMPGFEARMPALKDRLTPKLKLLGAAVAERWNEGQHEILYPHVAQHLRRSVNPSVETWCALSRAKRAYKPYVHYRVAISADRLRVTVFVEDYADEKESFARNLAENADRLAEYVAHQPFILAYDIPNKEGEPQHGHALDGEALRCFSGRMLSVKGQHASFGMQFAKSHNVVKSGVEIVEAALEAMRKLKPIYDLGTTAAIEIPAVMPRIPL